MQNILDQVTDARKEIKTNYFPNFAPIVEKLILRTLKSLEIELLKATDRKTSFEVHMKLQHNKTKQI